ncbi:Uncharacterised protein [Flavonifractor plautii]|uniref:Uncharacterized protein n=1 Tax=Flavonifractor plautii TaxID=292800 RepID=A0A174THD7_FLAPL|nr:Uncharacterised protein [Flavonifractor plautii]
MASKVTPSSAQWAAVPAIWPVRSRKVAFSLAGNAVWAERQAVSSGQHSPPMAANTGSTTVVEQRPKPEIS